MSFSFKSSSMTRRRFLTNSAVTMGSIAGAGALLDACNTSTTTNGKNVTTLTVLYASSEMTPVNVSQFEKENPDIKINFIEYDENRLDAMLAANTPPDFVRGTGIGSAYYSARGLALNLDSYLSKSSVIKENDLMPINNAWRWNGTKTGSGSYYGLVKDWSQDSTLWANEALFNKAGLALPSTMDPMTYDNLLSLSEKLAVHQDGKMTVYGLDPQWLYCSGIIMQAMMQQNDPIYNSDLSEVNFASPAGKKAIDFYINFAKSHSGFSPFDPNPDGESNDGPVYSANRLGINLNGYWFAGSISTAPASIKQNSRLLPAPQMGPKRVSVCYTGTGAWIPANSKNKDAAWRLMEYFIGGQPAVERAESGWGIPALKSLLSKMPQGTAYQKAAYETTQNELPYLGLVPDSPYIAANITVNATFDKYMQQAVKGQISSDECAERVTEDLNNQLKQEKQQIG